MTRFDPPPAQPLPAWRRDAMRRQLETLVRQDLGRRAWRKPAVLAGAAAVVMVSSAGRSRMCSSLSR